jgi:hypothetical protein
VHLGPSIYFYKNSDTSVEVAIMPTREFITFVEYDDSSSDSKNGKSFDGNDNDQGCTSSSSSSSSRLHYSVLPR